jgi:hypothetical protein
MHATGFAIFILIIIALNPKMIPDLESSILGRCIIIASVLLFTWKNISLGIVAVLMIIIFSRNKFNVEGMTIGDDTQLETNVNDITKEAATNTSNNLASNMVDMSKTISPVDSNKFPITKTISDIDTTKPHSQKMLDSSAKQLDTFTNYATVH